MVKQDVRNSIRSRAGILLGFAYFVGVCVIWFAAIYHPRLFRLDGIKEANGRANVISTLFSGLAFAGTPVRPTGLSGAVTQGKAVQPLRPTRVRNGSDRGDRRQGGERQDRYHQGSSSSSLYPRFGAASRMRRVLHYAIRRVRHSWSLASLEGCRFDDAGDQYVSAAVFVFNTIHQGINRLHVTKGETAPQSVGQHLLAETPIKFAAMFLDQDAL
jgi:hypothetical protein